MPEIDPFQHLSDAAMDAGRLLDGVIVRHEEFDRCAKYILSAIQMSRMGGFYGARIAAASGTGKTLLIELVERLMAERFGMIGCISMIKASLKERPTVAQIQGDILDSMSYPLRPSVGRRSGTNGEVNRVLVKTIADHNVRLLAIDEFQHVFHANGNKIYTEIIDWLKRLMNMTGVAVLLVGTEQMDLLDGVDPQLTTRIPTVLRLSQFRFDSRWRGFLNGFVAECREFDLSPILTELARPLWLASDGNPRALKGLLKQAVALAVNNDINKVNVDVLQKSFYLRYGEESLGKNPFDVC